MVSGLNGTYEDKLSRIGMLSLENRRVQLDLVQVFKIVHGIDDVSVEKWFKLMGNTPMTIT